MEKEIRQRSTNKARREKNNSNVVVKRKIAHNEVECRRKLKITKCITQLANIVEPSCHCGKETRVNILQKVLDRIQHLEKSNQKIRENLKQYSSESETFLQQQLALVLVDHLGLVLSFLKQQRKREEVNAARSSRVSSVRLDTDSQERLGFGVPDLQETYERPMGLQAPIRVHDWTEPVVEDVSHLQQTNNIRMSYHMEKQIEPSIISSDHSWQIPATYPQIQDGVSWGHPYSVIPSLPVNAPLHDCQRFEPHQSHPPYIPDNRTATDHAQTVWRPYNDPQTPSQSNIPMADQQICLSSQSSSSFLVGQLLENII